MKPILDTMQVMPAFVYLFPALFFFGIGGAPAILATMIYAMPPVIRLTNAGVLDKFLNRLLSLQLHLVQVNCSCYLKLKFLYHYQV